MSRTMRGRDWSVGGAVVSRFCFFFQAEDGIRDLTVTGVQTCALPICVTDNGDVAPARALKGAKTQIKNPTGIFVDAVHDELVVANMGNHSATVYSRTAEDRKSVV